jgi:hypothetical protein
MNSFRVMCVICAVLTWPLNGQEHNRLTPEEKAAGWELLFDGATTKGWRSLNDASFPRSSWVVEDGALHSLGEPPDNPWIDLVTTESFGDFELALDWKLTEKGNTGIKYLVQDAYFGELLGARRGPKALGFEFQLVDDQRDADALSSAKQRSGSLYYLLPPNPEPNPSVGSWNSARLIVRNGEVEHWVNGQRVLRFALASPQLREALDQAIASNPRPMTLAGLRAMRELRKTVTPIALQHHIGTVWFRNVKVRRLNTAK